MVDRITASADALLRQASMTAADYMREAVREIDGQFGEGYAKQHPELVAVFMTTAAQDFHTALSTGALQDLTDVAESLVEEVRGVVDAIKGE